MNSSQQPRFAAACRLLDEAIAARAFPGCAFGLLAGGAVVLEGASGRFTYDEASPPVTPATVYDVASLTKVAATTAAAMLLHQQGRLDLETPLAELLPGFLSGRAASDPARRVTLRHLLAHNSGLPGYVEFFRTATTPEALMQACLALPLEAAPGERADYSDPGFILLGKALEALTGEALATWVAREIFQPLGLSATGFCPPAAAREPRFRPPRRTPPSAIAASRARSRTKTPGCWAARPAMPGSSPMCPTCCALPARFFSADSGKARLFNAATVELFARGKARRAARARWAGIRPRSPPPRAAISRPIRSATWASAAARSGSTWMPRSPLCC